MKILSSFGLKQILNGHWVLEKDAYQFPALRNASRDSCSHRPSILKIKVQEWDPKAHLDLGFDLNNPSC